MIRVMKYGELPDDEIFARAVPAVDVESTVSRIIKNVRERGDAALFEYCEEFDGVKLDSLAVSDGEIARAVAETDPEFMAVLEEAARNISAFHSKQIRTGFEIRRSDGAVLGQKITPVDSAGIYVPGGTAAYPSTVLMNAIPAKLAGVGKVIMVTPPGRDGKVSPAILAAASVAGVDRVFRIGGAQAIAALAFGTRSVPRVDKIVGPGNAFVAEAKKQVFGAVSIDMIAGPSEILIVADGASDPRFVAADMLSQAEHDRLASAVLVTDSDALALAVSRELERQIPLLDRRDIARASIDANGKIIIAESVAQAVEIANAIAPEHLELCVDEPFALLDRVRHAGSVFLGRSCPEALGDYMAGPNHTLPTGGTARFSSPLSVDDFIKKTQYACFSPEAFGKIAGKVALFARKEGLTGHAASVTVRTEENRK